MLGNTYMYICIYMYIVITVVCTLYMYIVCCNTYSTCSHFVDTCYTCHFIIIYTVAHVATICIYSVHVHIHVYP